MKNKEFEYQVIMNIARALLKKHLITEEQYRSFNTIMLAKYAPKNRRFIFGH